MRKATSAAWLCLLLWATPAMARGPHHRWGPWQRYWITGYCYGQLTATGTVAHVGEVAVDPSVIRLGAYLQIRGIAPYVGVDTFHAEDTGGAVLGRHIDVFTDCPTAYRITGYWPVRLRR